jgi:hypothetical protein
MVMKRLLYLAFSLLVPLAARAANDAMPLAKPATPVENQIVRCVEAEHATGNGPVTSDPNASNGSTRGDENYAEHYVDYNIYAIEVAGPHELKLQYYASGAPIVNIIVNGQAVVSSLTLPSTHSWNIVHREETFTVSLHEGTNVIRIQCLPGAGLRQDKICVTGPAVETPPCDFSIAASADQPVYAPSKNIYLSSNCTGAACNTVTYNWSGNGVTSSWGSLNFTSPAQGGTYSYIVTASKEGCITQTDTVVVQVDESLPGCDFQITASPSTTTPGCSSPVSLSAGCTGGDCGELTYNWSGPGVAQTGQTIAITTPSGTGSYTYTLTATGPGCIPKTTSLTLDINNCNPPSSGDFSACLEAENANGNGSVTGDPNASNGSTRGEESNYDHYVDYAVNGVPAAGNYLVKLRYYSSGAAQAVISVNGNVVIPSASFPSSNSWNIAWREETFTVTLNEGNNLLRIQGLPGNSIRQDKICVTGSGSGQPTCAFNIAPTSNAPVYDRSKPMTLKANCTGADCPGVTYTWSGNGVNASGETVEITSPATTGHYTYHVTASKPGCADKTGFVTVIVDWGVAPCRYLFFVEPQSTNITCSKPVILYARCFEYDCDNVTFTWDGPGLNQQQGQAVNLTTPAAAGTYVYTVTGSKPGCETKTAEYTLNITECTPPVGENFEVCLEAETQDGSAPVTNDPNASNGGTRGDESNYRHYVNYAVNDVPADGMYQLALRYSASTSPQVTLRGNDGYMYYNITIPATNSWNIVFREEIFNVPLRAGNNIVKIEGAPGPALRQDRICIKSMPQNNARIAVPESAYQFSERQEKLNIFPNPSPGEFNASFDMADDNGKITVTDPSGKVWYNATVKGKGAHHEKIKLPDAPAGIYIMQVKSGKKTDSKKMLLMR